MSFRLPGGHALLDAMDGIQFAFHLLDGPHRKDSISGVLPTDRTSAFSRCRLIFAHTHSGVIVSGGREIVNRDVRPIIPCS